MRSCGWFSNSSYICSGLRNFPGVSFFLIVKFIAQSVCYNRTNVLKKKGEFEMDAAEIMELLEKLTREQLELVYWFAAGLAE